MWRWKAWCWRIENVLGEYLGTVRRMLDGWKICEVGLISGNRKIHTTLKSLKNITYRKPNWKSPEPDFVQGVHPKSLTVCTRE